MRNPAILLLLALIQFRPAARCAPAGLLTWDSVQKTYHAKAGESKANFVFTVRNASRTEVAVTSVETSCSCTTAGFPMMPWKIPPGGSSRLNATVDFTGGSGMVTRTITVDSDAGRTMLIVTVDAGAALKRVDIRSLLERIPAPVGLAHDQEAERWSPRLIATVQAIADESDGVLRYQRIDGQLDSLDEKDYRAILDLMLLPEARTTPLVDLASKVFRRWTQVAPARAVAWLPRLPDGTAFGREAYSIAGEAMAQAGSKAALAWLGRLPSGSDRAAAQFSVAGAIAHSDPRAAISLALGLPASASRDGLLGYCVLNWSVKDFDGAANWVAALSDADLRDRIGARIATQEAVRNPARAAQFAIRAIRPGEVLNRTVSQVVRFWAAASPESAAAWVKRLRRERLRPVAVRALVETWEREDEPAARKWLRTLPTVAARPSADAADLVRATPDGNTNAGSPALK